jgi:hypothetical protein
MRVGRVLLGPRRAGANGRRARAAADISQSYRDIAQGSLDLGGAWRDIRREFVVLSVDGRHVFSEHHRPVRHSGVAEVTL